MLVSQLSSLRFSIEDSEPKTNGSIASLFSACAAKGLADGNETSADSRLGGCAVTCNETQLLLCAGLLSMWSLAVPVCLSCKPLFFAKSSAVAGDALIMMAAFAVELGTVVTVDFIIGGECIRFRPKNRKTVRNSQHNQYQKGDKISEPERSVSQSVS